ISECQSSSRLCTSANCRTWASLSDFRRARRVSPFGNQRLVVESGLHLPGFMLEGLGNNLENYMTLLSAREKVVASNIANADTPGYKTQDIDFSSVLEDATSGGAPRIMEPAGLRVKNDGNNVDLDREARL